MADEYDIIVENLDEVTCWRLLARARFGRVGFAQGDEIVVLPVNSGVNGERVVFRTALDTSLAAAGKGSVVAFEADHIDPVAESGWSVLVRGRLWDVTDRSESMTWNELAVRPWAPGPRDRWMMIEPTLVTGRMIERHRNLGAARRVPYMSPD